MKCLKYYALFVSLISLTHLSPTYAYRGQEFSSQVEPPSIPSEGLPGYFDSFVASRGKLVFELPTFSADYGVTNDFTVGANVLPYSYLLLQKKPAFSIKGRYRFFSNGDFVSSITGYVGYIGGMQGVQFGGIATDSTSFSYGSLTTNTSYFFSRFTMVNLHLGILKLGFSSTAGQRYEESLTGLGFMAGLGAQHFLNETFGLEIQLMVPAGVRLAQDSSLMSLDMANNLKVVGQRYLLHLKTGERAMLSGGIGAAYLYGESRQVYSWMGTFAFSI